MSLLAAAPDIENHVSVKTSHHHQRQGTDGADGALGANYCVGHSYVTPGAGDRVRDPVSWFRDVVETEIGPLLEEYWFDRPERAQEETDRLLAGW